MRRRILLLLFILIAPFGAHAAVYINEIAWMGTDASGTCEWVELYNDGAEDVDLSSWSLTIKNPGSEKTLLFNESGSVRFSHIAANGFYFLSRSGSCTPPVTDGLIDWRGSFGNGISNDGALLILKQGVDIITQVDASAGWSASGIGGSNTVPKKTPQFTGAIWHQALPTPKATNVGPDLEEIPEEEPEEEPQQVPKVTVGGTVPQLPVKSPVPKLHLTSIPARIVLAGAATRYHAVAYDSAGKLRKDVVVRWTFGDGGTEEGTNVTYAYREPGSYTAVVRATGRDGISSVELVTVTVEEAEVAVSGTSEEGIELTNASDRLADLSAWKLRSGKKTFALPDDTVIAGGSTVTFPWSVTRLPTTTDPLLLYPDSRPVE